VTDNRTTAASAASRRQIAAGSKGGATVTVTEPCSDKRCESALSQTDSQWPTGGDDQRRRAVLRVVNKTWGRHGLAAVVGDGRSRCIIIVVHYAAAG